MSFKYTQLMVSASVLSAALLTAQPLSAETLTEAVEQTIRTNPTVLAEESRRLSVEQTVKQAESGYYPKADLNLGIGRERSDNVTTRPDHRKWLTRGESGITASQMLYDGFATKNLTDQTGSLAESAGYSVTDTAESISLSAIQAYLDVLRRQQLLSLTEANLDSHEHIHSQIKLRSDSGVGNKADVVQSRGRVALSQANLAANKGNLDDAEASYLRVIGSQSDSLEDPTDECCNSAPATLEDAIKIAYYQHPALRAAIAQHEAALAQQQGAEAPMHPRVDLELAATANNDLDGSEGHNNDAQAMFRLKYNLLNGGADSAHIDETGYLSEQAKAEANLAKRQIEQDVRLAWNSLETLTDRLQYLQQRVTSTKVTREAYQQQFNLGQRTLLDLLDTENEVLTAGTDYVNAKYDRIYACYWLAESMGQLLESLKLEVPSEAVVAANP